jgi:mono/diheme cytochrome c family protein
MGAMQRKVLLAVVAAAGLIVARGAYSAQKNGAPQATDTQIDRGRYLAEEVARCSECHTPRDAQNNLEHDRWLQGAPIWITPVRHDSNWAERAPALAGLPGYTDQQAEQVLEKGIGPNGAALRLPMHTYHLKPDDARAIIAYLRSLPRGSDE